MEYRVKGSDTEPERGNIQEITAENIPYLMKNTHLTQVSQHDK